MRGKVSLFIAALVLLTPGCSLISDGVHVVSTSFEDAVSDVREYHRDRQWAREAWAELRSADPNHSYSDDFACGFQDGYAEYLFRGGKGEPPPVAPPKYRKFRYQTPQGYQAITDWFAGYRHGALAAKESNYRRWITGPSSVMPGALHEPAVAPSLPAIINLDQASPVGVAVPPLGNIVPAARFGKVTPVDQ